MPTFETLHIVPGYRCNLCCRHCGNHSGPDRTEHLSRSEIDLLKATIASYSPPRLLFTGGEPTLHLELINELLSAHPSLESTFVLITTNGHFAARGSAAIGTTLRSIRKVSYIQLSMDRFHGNDLRLEAARKLHAYCISQGIGLSVSMCLTAPEQLIQAQQFQQELGLPIAYQKVEACGRALKCGLTFRYPAFQREVYDSRCPNLGTVSYHCGLGFSLCCANLICNAAKLPGLFHRNLSDHLQSRFYRERASKTLGQIAQERTQAKVDLSWEFSSPCRFCESLYAQDCFPRAQQPHIAEDLS